MLGYSVILDNVFALGVKDCRFESYYPNLIVIAAKIT